MSASTASDLSELLSNVKEKIASNTAERKQLADSLREIAGEARSLLAQMGESQDRSLRGRRPGTGKRGPGRPRGSGRKRKPMSPEAKAKIAAAQKRRWAAVRAGEKKK